MKIAGCWANVDDECEGPLSGEHPLSKCLFDDQVTVQGFDWCLEPITIGIGRLVSKHFCRGHNSRLSELDAEAQSFRMAISWFDETCLAAGNGEIPQGASKVRVIDGRKLERWCCKAALGCAIMSGHSTVPLAEELLPFLVGQKRFNRHPWGISFLSAQGMKIHTAQHYEICPLTVSDDPAASQSGTIIKFRGVQLLLLLPFDQVPTTEFRVRDTDGTWLEYKRSWHLKKFEFEAEQLGVTHHIRFQW